MPFPQPSHPQPALSAIQMIGRREFLYRAVNVDKGVQNCAAESCKPQKSRLLVRPWVGQLPSEATRAVIAKNPLPFAHSTRKSCGPCSRISLATFRFGNIVMTRM
jgi:hypothetical protein